MEIRIFAVPVVGNTVLTSNMRPGIIVGLAVWV